MLVSLSEMKSFLGIAPGDTTYDDFLTQQEIIISSAVQNYCGRVFSQGTYTQTFYRDMIGPTKELVLYHYPVTAISSVLERGEEVVSSVRLHTPTGIINRKEGFLYGDETEVSYTAGYSTTPALIQAVVLSLVSEKYNKKKAGIDINFGSDVQSISIPSVISVTFDYTLTSNDRNNGFGAILGKYLNVLDAFRSERTVIGSSVRAYVS